MKTFLTHLYLNCNEYRYCDGRRYFSGQIWGNITSKISDVIDSADREIDDVQRSVTDWNEKILD